MKLSEQMRIIDNTPESVMPRWIHQRISEWRKEVAQLEAEIERLRKIEDAAKAIDKEWFIDYEECPEEVRVLHKALRGE